jgi:hypothetical protein
MELTQKEIDAFNHVKESVEKLRAEYDITCQDISKEEKLLKELPLLPVPPDDLKAAIIDMIDASGVNYRTAIKRHIKELATNVRCGFNLGSPEFDLMGTPLRFLEISAALYGTESRANVGYQNILTSSNIGLVDAAIFSVAGELVKELLASVMEEMTPDELGYGKILSSKIGTDRATRRATIQATEDRLSILYKNKTTLSESLGQLGISVPA